MNYFDLIHDQKPNLICNELQHGINCDDYSILSDDDEYSIPLQQSSICQLSKQSSFNQMVFKDNFQITPLNFAPENDTKTETSLSSISSPQHEGGNRSMSQPELIVPAQPETQESGIPNINIDTLFSDYKYSPKTPREEYQQTQSESQNIAHAKEEKIFKIIEIQPKTLITQTKTNHAAKATESIKKIVRLFRKYIKDSSDYNSKQIETYFTASRFTFSEDTFEKNLGLFQELTCSCKSEKTVSENVEDLKLLHTVFNKSPSKGNLAKFFEIPIIRDLWWGDSETTSRQSFFKSKVLNQNLMGLHPEMLLKVNNFFSSVQTPDDKQIIPV